ncbi:hypothetical protein YA32_06265 [Klebsiella aerogenes]|nr:hypothetical protein YA32_06265 [Klebsiella aerogenes]
MAETSLFEDKAQYDLKDMREILGVGDEQEKVNKRVRNHRYLISKLLPTLISQLTFLGCKIPLPIQEFHQALLWVLFSLLK